MTVIEYGTIILLVLLKAINENPDQIMWQTDCWKEGHLPPLI
jgi:hypothetical protein